jgi:predicted DNA-binding transcriptional regulator YafY
MKKFAKNFELQHLIKQILRNSENGSLTAKEVLERIKNIYKYPCSLKTVYNHLNEPYVFEDARDVDGNPFYPRRFKILAANDKKVIVDFNLEEAQILLWAIQNLKDSSTDFFNLYTKSTTEKVLSSVSKERRLELEKSTEAFKKFVGIYKKPYSFPKNNLSNLIVAIREGKWVSAKIKDYKLNEKNRHLVRKLAIGSFTFKNNIPYIIAKDESEVSSQKMYKSIRATRLNDIKILDEKIPNEILDYIREYDFKNNIVKIKIKSKGYLAQIFRESIISATQKNIESSKDTILTELNIRVSNSFINMLLPHARDIISIEPRYLATELKKRSRENLEALKKFI